LKITIKGIAGGIAFASVCGILLFGLASARPQVTPLAPLGINSADKMVPNGEYVVSVWRDGSWRTAGSLTCDRFFRERTIDLADLVTAGQPARIGISQKGGGAAHIDAALLGGVAPEKIKGADEPRALAKLSKQDFDVIDSFHKIIELSYPAVGKDRTLSLTARVESVEISKTPFQFPPDNLFKPMNKSSRFYSYQLNSEKANTPFFKEYSQTGSGHPSGFTYGWVRNDGKNLYVKIDFTPDNTVDGDKDYAKVYVNTPKGLKEFKVSVPDTNWGRADFTYTDKVSYEHKVYDFTIPLNELGVMSARKAKELQLAFAAYGTATPGDYQPSLVHNSTNNTYLLTFTRTGTDVSRTSTILGQLLTNSGAAAGSEFVVINPNITNSYGLNARTAYDSNHNRFFTVSDRFSTANWDITGQLVNADITLQGSMVSITTDTAGQQGSSAAYGLANDRFLVAWSDMRNLASTNYDIYGALVSAASGSLISTVSGTNFIIANAMLQQLNTTVSYDNTNQRFLVAWQDARVSGIAAYDIYGALVSASTGTLFTTVTGTNFIISNAADSQQTPAAAYDPVNHRFLVAWMDNRNTATTGDDIYGALVSATTGTLYTTATGTNFVISNAANTQGAPSVVYDSSHMRFLVVWADQRNVGATASDIYGRYVNVDGSMAGSEFIIANTTDSETGPSAAYNSNCGNTLVTYATGSGGVYDIGATLIGTCPPELPGNGQQGCFIATAAYGGDMAADVKLLRGFRDKHLLTNAFGRAFVSAYYRYSPPVAEFIAGSEPLKVVVRAVLAPVVFTVRYPFFVLAALLTLVFVTVYRLSMRRSRHT